MSPASHSGEPIRCDVCQTTFTRQEHLIRHARSHTTEKPFQCLDCGKRFARLDVLQRHSQSHGAKAMSADGGNSRACKECAVSRVRCARGNPCERCDQRDLQCEYPMAKKRKARPQSAPRVRSPPSRDDLVFPDDDNFLLNPPNPSTSGANSCGSQALRLGEVIQDTGLDSQILEKDFSEWVRSMPSVNWLSPQGPDDLFADSQLDELLMPNINPAVMGGILNEDGLHSGLGQSGYEPMPDPSLGAAQRVQPQGPRSRSVRRDPLPSDSGVESLTIQPAEGTYYVEGAVGRAPFQGRSSWRPSGLSWRMNTGGSGGEQTPAFSESSVIPYQSDFVSDSVYESSLRHLQAECEAVGIDLDPVQLPSISEMQDLVQLYFEGFQATYPFLQKCPSLFVPSHSWILLLSVAAMGSPYARTARSHQLGDYLARVVYQILTRRVGELGADDEDGDDKPWIPAAPSKETSSAELMNLQAGVLNCLFLLHSGKRGLASRALIQRHSLVEASSRLNLLSAARPSSIETSEGSNGVDTLKCWIDSESRIRTGWMIWLLDSIAEYEFNCLPLMQIGDARAPLPCREEIWNSCRASLTPAERGSHSVTLLEALEMLHIEKTLPPNLGDLSTNVLILAVCRRNREATLQHQTELTFWSPNAKRQPRSSSRGMEEAWPPAIPSLSKWRNSACDCLDILHWNANSTAARAGGWEHTTILHLHIARLVLLAPMQHIQQLTLQDTSKAAQGPESATSINTRYQVLRWAVRDQYKARLSVIHAGALLWHVPRYSSNGPLEPYALYAATLVIWAYSISVQFARARTLSQNPGLDVSSPSDGQMPQDEAPVVTDGVDSDDSDGDVEPTLIQLDRPCDDEIVQAYVCLGHKMVARISKVGDIMNSSAPRRILKRGIRLLTRAQGGVGVQSPPGSATLSTTIDSEAAFPRWGVERSFTDSLKALLSVPISLEQNCELANGHGG